MKKYIGLFIILICLTSTAFYETLALNQGGGKGKKGVQSTVLQRTAANPASSVMNINNVTSWVNDNGQMPAIIGGGSWNGSFPKGQVAGFIYQEGVVWGGLVNDGGSEILRVGGNTYFNGTQKTMRLFRVRPDWANADLTDDAANFFLVPSASVTAAQIAQIKAQYATDWNEWPGNQGAPYEDVNHDGVYEPNIDIPGIPGASQTLFISDNDGNAVNAYGSLPIGLQINQVFWAYSIANPLGNVIFKKVDIVYNGLAGGPSNATIDSMYIVQWADPDVGNSTDDFAGCDTTLGLGYCYNSTFNDAIYKAIGSAPPAGGYDFLQGVAQPTGNPADSAVIDLKYRHGYAYTNLNGNDNSLSTFVYFAAGGAWTDPDGQAYTGTRQWYSLMRGYQPEQYPISTPFPTNVSGVDVGGNGTYLLPGDPVTHTGWVDGQVEGAGDRRICLVTGPFTMTLGDTAEIVSALVGAIGADNLSSINVMKFYDKFAQYAYDQLFNLPSLAPPKVDVFPENGGVMLNWGNRQNLDNIEKAPHAGYDFEGYIVYQLPSATTDLTNAKRVATYDVVDNITTVFDEVFDQATGAVVSKPVVFGTDNGIQRTLEIKNDAIRGNVPMVNGTDYYFAVTAYAYNPDANVPFHILESSPVPLHVVPQILNPGVSYGGKATGDTLAVTHTGPNNGQVFPVVIDPSKFTGHTYKVTFSGDPVTWSLEDSTLGKTLLSGQTNQSGNPDYLVIDGVQTKVEGPPLDFNYFNVIANADGPLDPPVTFAADYNGFPTGGLATGDGDQQVDGSYWLIASTTNTHNSYSSVFSDITQYSGGYGEANQGIKALIPDDFEIRFDATGSDGDIGFSGTYDGQIIHLPFSIWCVPDPSDPSKDFQVYTEILDVNNDGVFDLGDQDNAMSSANNDPYTDGMYMVVPKDRTPGSSGYQALLNFASDTTNNGHFSTWYAWAYNYGPPEYPSDPFASYPGLIRTVLVNWNGGTVPGPYNAPMPEQGSIFYIATTKPNTSADSFVYTEPAVTKSVAKAKMDVEKINVFPNPYYGFNSRETSRAGKYVTFSHLPNKATIRIFDLAGKQVRVIHKNDNTQFINWDLLNENSYPVASGVYVVYVDMPGIGATKILKLAVVQEQQILNVY